MAIREGNDQQSQQNEQMEGEHETDEKIVIFDSVMPFAVSSANEMLLDISQTLTPEKCREMVYVRFYDQRFETKLSIIGNQTFIWHNNKNRTSWRSFEIDTANWTTLKFMIFIDENRFEILHNKRKGHINFSFELNGQLRITVHTTAKCKETIFRLTKVSDNGEEIDTVSDDFKESNELIQEENTPVFRMALIIFVPIAVLATIPSAILMWIEAIEKRRYQLAKDKPVKLKLTREYLAKIRPPKKRSKVVSNSSMHYSAKFTGLNWRCASQLDHGSSLSSLQYSRYPRYRDLFFFLPLPLPTGWGTVLALLESPAGATLTTFLYSHPLLEHPTDFGLHFNTDS